MYEYKKFKTGQLFPGIWKRSHAYYKPGG